MIIKSIEQGNVKLTLVKQNDHYRLETKLGKDVLISLPSRSIEKSLEDFSNAELKYIKAG